MYHNFFDPFFGPATFAVLGSVLYLLFLLLFLILAGEWKVYSKMGEPGWKCLIPFYNSYIMFERTWDVQFFWLYLVLSIFSWIFSCFTDISYFFDFFGVLFLIGTLFVNVIQTSYLSKSFNQSAAFTVGLVLLPVIFLPILGFGKEYEYIGNTYQTDTNKKKNKENKNNGTADICKDNTGSQAEDDSSVKSAESANQVFPQKDETEMSEQKVYSTNTQHVPNLPNLDDTKSNNTKSDEEDSFQSW